MMQHRLTLFAGVLAVAALALLTSVPPPLVAIGLGLAVAALVAAAPVRREQTAPRSIFETRRAGLA